MGRIYPAEINRILFKPGGPIGKVCRSVAMDIAVEARRLVETELGHNPFDQPRTGKLASAYQVKVVEGTNNFYVHNPKKYAAAIEFGARPHKINVRRQNSFLVFRGRDGVWHRVKVVNHPGNRAYRTLSRAANTVVVRRFGSIQRR